MPYTIIVCDDNSLYGSRKRKIMQREKLFNKLWILVPPCYNGFDMSQCVVTMRYLRPISKDFVTETLVLSNEKYEEYLKYVLPVDTCLSKEHGELKFNLTFTMLDVDTNGNVVQRVRKTDDHILTITKIPDWDSIVPDESLAALDQRITAQTAQIKALEALAENLNTNKVDNLVYDAIEDTLQLYANGIGVGDKVSVREMTEDGIPVVDFENSSGDANTNHNCGCNCNCEDNVVEFGASSDEDEIETPNDENNVIEF